MRGFGVIDAVCGVGGGLTCGSVLSAAAFSSLLSASEPPRHFLALLDAWRARSTSRTLTETFVLHFGSIPSAQPRIHSATSRRSLLVMIWQ